MTDRRPVKRVRTALSVPIRPPAKVVPASNRRPSEQTVSANNNNMTHPASDESSAIAVFVRCRAVLPSDSPDALQVVKPDSSTRGNSITVQTASNNVKQYSFAQGRVYGNDADQGMLYLDIAKPTIAEAIRGYNCTVFAYGQTGSGKTYTMEGDLTASNGTFTDGAGLVPRILYALFHTLSKTGADFTISCSYLEIYNDTLRDLTLPSTAKSETALRIVDDKNAGSVTVQGLEEVYIQSAEQGVELLRKGSQLRQTVATSCNESSSRSHTLFTINLVVHDSGEGGREDVVRTGKINLVDLAGSENVGRSGVQGSHAREAGQINSSLLALGRVINALADTKTSSTHIPYRESKLTRILQDSLGGTAKTFIVATLCPFDAEESLSTLDYASRASTIKNRPEANKKISKSALLTNYGAELDRLKRELYAARQKEGVYLPLEDFKAAQASRDDEKNQLKEALRANEVLESKLSTLEARFEQNAFLLSETVVNLEESRALCNEQHATRMDLERLLAQSQAENADLYGRNERLQVALDDRTSQLSRCAQEKTELNEFVNKRTTDLLNACERVRETTQKDFGSIDRRVQDLGKTVNDFLRKMDESLPDLYAIAQRGKDAARQVDVQALFGETERSMISSSQALLKASDDLARMVPECQEEQMVEMQRQLCLIGEVVGEIECLIKQEICAIAENVESLGRKCNEHLCDMVQTSVSAMKDIGDAFEVQTRKGVELALAEAEAASIEREASLIEFVKNHAAAERESRTRLRETATGHLDGFVVDHLEVGTYERKLAAPVGMLREILNDMHRSTLSRGTQLASDVELALSGKVPALVLQVGTMMGEGTTKLRAVVDGQVDIIDQCGADMIDATESMTTKTRDLNRTHVARFEDLEAELMTEVRSASGGVRNLLVTQTSALQELREANAQFANGLEAHRVEVESTANRRPIPLVRERKQDGDLVLETAPLDAVPALKSKKRASSAVTTTTTTTTVASSPSVSTRTGAKKARTTTTTTTANVLKPVDVNRRLTSDAQKVPKRKASEVVARSQA